MKVLAFVRWGSGSLWRHIVLLQVVFGLPLSLVFLAQDFSDGTLTTASVERVLLAALFGALAFAVVGWYLIVPGISGRKR